MAPTPMALHLALGVLWVGTSAAYFADWSTLGGRPNEPTCVDIPKNMTLCSDIGYDKMRLPNLLEHDTLAEVQQQSGSWVPLLNVRCHPNTKLFLCSLFTPVCLENEIFPCRSLCEAVQKGCETRMRTYGYDWPSMLSCERFPHDNDMCIKSYDEEKNKVVEKDDYCSVCSPVETFENIMDNYCRSDFVTIARIKRQIGPRVKHRNVKILKSRDSSKSSLRRSKMFLEGESGCCSFVPGKQKYLIMGSQKRFTLSPTFVLPFRKTKTIKRAVRKFSTIDCKDPNLFSSTIKEENEAHSLKSEPKKKRKRGRKRRKNKKTSKNNEKRKNKRNRRRKYRKQNGKRKNGRGDESSFVLSQV